MGRCSLSAKWITKRVLQKFPFRMNKKQILSICILIEERKNRLDLISPLMNPLTSKKVTLKSVRIKSILVRKLFESWRIKF